MKQLTLRLPDELYKEAKRIAELEGFSFNAFAIQAFNFYIANHGVSKEELQNILKDYVKWPEK